MRTFTEYFGFKQDPFKRTPDVDFYFPTKMHMDAYDTLEYLIHSDEPFAVITGEPGTGKTITLKKFINELPDNIVSAYILFPNLSPEELFMAILEDFNIHVDKNLTKNALFARLRDFLISIKSEGKKAVIIIDEAQNLSIETLEELRLLSNLETEKDKLLKIILAGQPELDEKLNLESLRQLKQRVTLYARLDNIKEEDIKSYVISHLEKASQNNIRIQSGVIKKLAKISNGNPRLINTIMDKTIITAFLRNSHTITEEHLISAVISLNEILPEIKKTPSWKVIAGVSGSIIAVLCAVIIYLVVDKYNGSENMVQTAENNAVETSSNGVKAGVVAGTGTAADNNKVEKPVEKPVEKEVQETVNNAEVNQTEVKEETDNIAEEKAEEDKVLESVVPLLPEIETGNGGETVEAGSLDHSGYIKKDVYVLIKSLNVRNEPTLEGMKIASIKLGQRYELIQELDEWVEIRLSPTQTGWVFKQYVSISEIKQ